MLELMDFSKKIENMLEMTKNLMLSYKKLMSNIKRKINGHLMGATKLISFMRNQILSN